MKRAVAAVVVALALGAAAFIADVVVSGIYFASIVSATPQSSPGRVGPAYFVVAGLLAIALGALTFGATAWLLRLYRGRPLVPLGATIVGPVSVWVWLTALGLLEPAETGVGSGHSAVQVLGWNPVDLAGTSIVLLIPPLVAICAVAFMPQWRHNAMDPQCDNTIE